MTTATEPAIETIPPLADGDRLDRAEFRRRYEAMPPGIKAELIDGVVCMASPVNRGLHSRPHFLLSNWLAYYVDRTPGVDAAIDASHELDDANEPQPDLALFLEPECGGRSSETPEGWAVGVPEFAIEVANTTARLDLTRKRAMYERFGASEYLVWRTRDNTLHWFTRGTTGFEPLTAAADGLFRSRVFPGLWLDPVALAARDRAALEAVVVRGCQTAEHADFVARLAAARTQGGQP